MNLTDRQYNVLEIAEKVDRFSTSNFQRFDRSSIVLEKKEFGWVHYLEITTDGQTDRLTGANISGNKVENRNLF